MVTRGISPIVATTILIAIAVVAGIGVYYWSQSYAPRPTTPTEPVTISVRPVNQTVIKIANLGMSALSLSNITLSNGAKLKCSNGMLEPGSVVSCRIENTTIGEVALILPGATTQTIIVNTGDIDSPTISDIQDNGSNSIIGEAITVQATISDNFAVKNATLFYRESGGSWQSAEMSRISGTEKFGVWSASFTPNSVGNWEYYIDAEDTSNNTRQSQVVTRYISVVKFISPTPSSGSSLGSGNFTINLTLAGTPEQINLTFNGTNFTIYGGNEIYYYNFNNHTDTIGDMWDTTMDSKEYRKTVWGYVPTEGALPQNWYGPNLSIGPRNWCWWYNNGNQIEINYVESNISDPIINKLYTIGFNSTTPRNLTNMTNMYEEMKATLPSSNFTLSRFCLIDSKGIKACKNITFSANTTLYIWSNPETKSVKSTGYFYNTTYFNWSSVQKYEIELIPSTNHSFIVYMGPMRIAYPVDDRGEGIWGSYGLDVMEGKGENLENWCSEGDIGRVYLSKGIDNKHFTVSTWFRYPQIAENPEYFGILGMFGDANWCDGFTIGVTTSGGERYTYFRVGYDLCKTDHYKNNSQVNAKSFSVLDNKWHMLTGVENNTNISYYIDGNIVGSASMPASMYYGTHNGLIGAVGASITWSGVPTFGYIDEFHLYNYTLTPKQIALLYHMSYGKYYAEMHDLGAGSYTFKVSAKTSLGEGVTEERSVTVV